MRGAERGSNQGVFEDFGVVPVPSNLSVLALDLRNVVGLAAALPMGVVPGLECEDKKRHRQQNHQNVSNQHDRLLTQGSCHSEKLNSFAERRRLRPKNDVHRHQNGTGVVEGHGETRSARAD